MRGVFPDLDLATFTSARGREIECVSVRHIAAFGNAVLEIIPLRLCIGLPAGLFGWALIASARHFFASSALIGPTVFERSGGAVSARTAGAGRSNTTSIARSAVLVECILFRPPSRSACSVTEYSFVQGCRGAIALFARQPGFSFQDVLAPLRRGFPFLAYGEPNSSSVPKPSGSSAVSAPPRRGPQSRLT